MNHFCKKTVVVVAGLPYSGKTAIIKRLSEKLPGMTVFIDEIFRNFVLEEDISLELWLEEQSHLVESIIDRITRARESCIYVEIGILQTRYRKKLMHWILDNKYSLVPVLLQCESRTSIQHRQSERARTLAGKPDKLKIAIDLDELYGSISAAFEKPVKEEGFCLINTEESIEDNIEEILHLIL